MNNILTWCEIPVVDMQRAKNFYAEVIGVKFIDQDMDGFQMAMFETDDQMAASGALVKSDGYEPSATACVPYLTGGEDLSGALERAVKRGSEVLVPKTAIDDDGYFAQFIDSEGNRIGLFSLG